MLSWILSLAVGLALAALAYWRGRRLASGPALLRALAGTLVAALAFNAPLGPARPLPPWVAVDASLSWRSRGDDGAWEALRSRVDSLRAAGADSLLLVGDSLRGSLLPAGPLDSASRIAPLVEAARALGKPVVLLTDGRLDDAERVDELPEGSQLLVLPDTATADLAVLGLEAPLAALIGDTVAVTGLLRAAGGGSGSGVGRQAVLRLGGRVIAEQAIEPLAPFEERSLTFAVAVPAVEGEQALTLSLSAGDAVPANDSASRSLRVVGVASVALVSTSPDQDARLVLAVLRGTQRGAVRAFWRVAPGQWREGDGLRAVAEAQVRQAVERASLVVLHGDTAYFGPPRDRARGALVLMPRGSGESDHYVSAAGDSPLAPMLGDLPWDLLPPLRVGAAPRGTALTALEARRARSGAPRPVISLIEGQPRRVLVSADGWWRWRLRGGRPSDAFDAVWGTIFDWVVAAPAGASRTAGDLRVARELAPRPVALRSGPVGTAAARDLTPRARGAWWLALVALLALSAEWMLRRRIGWR